MDVSRAAEVLTRFRKRFPDVELIFHDAIVDRDVNDAIKAKEKNYER